MLSLLYDYVFCNVMSIFEVQTYNNNELPLIPFFFLTLLLSQLCDYKSVSKRFNPKKVKTNTKLEKLIYQIRQLIPLK